MRRGVECICVCIWRQKSAVRREPCETVQLCGTTNLY